MDSKDFVMWLNGFIEMTDAQSIAEKQWKMIKEHLALCTNKVTPTKIVGPIVAEPVKPVDWSKLFPPSKDVLPHQPLQPFPYPQPIWLGQHTVTC